MLDVICVAGISVAIVRFLFFVIELLIDRCGCMSMRRWSVEKVASWICELGPSYRKYSDTFVKRDIDGATLKLMDDELLIDLGVDDKLHRRRILSAIY